MKPDEMTHAPDLSIQPGRLVMHGRTYFLQTAQNIGIVAVPPNQSVAIFLILSGLPMLFLYGIGIVPLACGIIMAARSRPTYELRMEVGKDVLTVARAGR